MFGLDESHKGATKLARWGEWFFRRCANNLRDKGTQLILSGRVGTGKTHVAKALHRQLGAWAVDMSLDPAWQKFPQVSPFYDWSMISEVEQQPFCDILQDIHESRIIFLDDVGSEADRFRSGESATRLRRVLAKAEAKWLLITTNLSQAEFSNVYDIRVSDRLNGAHWCQLSDVLSYRPKLVSTILVQQRVLGDGPRT